MKTVLVTAAVMSLLVWVVSGLVIRDEDLHAQFFATFCLVYPILMLLALLRSSGSHNP